MRMKKRPRICPRCRAKRLIGKNRHCKECRTEINKKDYLEIKANPEARRRSILAARKGYDKRKLKRKTVLEYYSAGKPRCACCGEELYEFLEIDHIDGKGAKHRKEIKGDIVSWIIKNDFPIGFQILCSNCNRAKGIYGLCPHQWNHKRGPIRARRKTRVRKPRIYSKRKVLKEAKKYEKV